MAQGKSKGAGAPSTGKRSRNKSRVKIERITLDIVEAAEYVGVSKQLAYAEAKAGKWPIVRVRGRVCVVKLLLDEMLIAQARENWKP